MCRQVVCDVDIKAVFNFKFLLFFLYASGVRTYVLLLQISVKALCLAVPVIVVPQIAVSHMLYVFVMNK